MHALIIAVLFVVVAVSVIMLKDLIEKEFTLALVLIMFVLDGCIVFTFKTLNISGEQIAIGVMLGTVLKVFSVMLYTKLINKI